MKVLHVIPSIDKIRGGPSETIVDLVFTLNQQGIEADLLTAFSENSNYQVVDYSRIQDRIFLLPRKHFLFYEQYIPDQKAWLLSNISKYQLVHVHSIFNYSTHVAMTSARLNKIPFVLRPAGMLSSYHLKEKKRYLKKFWLDFVDKKNLDFCSAFHATTHAEQDELKKILPLSRVESIPHGICLPTLRQKKEDLNKKINLLFISRLNNKKNIPAILEAVFKATQKGMSLNLKIAGETNPGDENYKKYLQNIVQDLKIHEQVEFSGFLSGKAKEEAFKWADVFLLPSFYENFGVAVLEALSYSVPVIISPQVALSNEVKEFGGGWITDETHPQSPDSILKILELINQDRKLILEESIKARQVAERFSWENNAKALVSLYESILSKK